MKKKITAFLLAAAMLLSFAACSEKSDADAIIHECEVPVYDTVDMPLTIETEEDMRTAWKYVINKAIGDGATFNGVPVTRMSQAYFVEEAD